MKNLNIKAIVLKSIDYKEHDKLLKLLTETGEVISVLIRGIKKPAAKLKFAGQVFAFCDYSLVVKKEFYSVTGAKQIESLFSLAYDPESFVASSVCLEAAASLSKARVGEKLFTDILKTFSCILYNEKCPFAAATLFIYRMLSLGGYIEMPPAIKNFTYETLPLKNQSRTSLKALQHAIGILEEKLGVIVYSKISLYD